MPAGRNVISGVRHSYVIAYVTIVAISIIAFVLLVANDALEQLYWASRAHESWQVDELLWLFVIGAFALLAILVIRSRQLREEVALREWAEGAMRDMATFDQITGVANRLTLITNLEQQIAQARVEDRCVALLVIDVDQFMAVNEALGPAGGDDILRALAGRLRLLLGPEGMLARLGSDEFAVLQPIAALERLDEVIRLARRILAALRQPFHTEAGPMSLTVSIGIATFPRDATDERELLRVAEVAQLQAKATGKDRFALFDPSLDARQRGRAELESEFRTALVDGEIIAYYQPLIALASGEVVGVEALARWRHPRRGLLEPAAFIDLVEEISLAELLFERMLRLVCADTASWPAELVVAVNISPNQLLDPLLARKVFALLDDCGYPVSRLEIEITETALLLDLDAARRTISGLKERGVRLSLDDFGTGFSSFTHLSQLAFDKLKIDQSFTRGLPNDPQHCKIVSSMIGLGHALGLTTVAEGVENLEQAGWLREWGCDIAQGFVFARPLPPENVARLFGVDFRAHAPHVAKLDRPDAR